VYFLERYLEYAKELGGIAAVEEINRQKQQLLYDTIDGSDGYYRGTTEKASRSWMNVTMRMTDEELEKRFIAEAKADGLAGLKGHRSVGGIRASIYNAVSLEAVQSLVAFMKDFQAKNG